MKRAVEEAVTLHHGMNGCELNIMIAKQHGVRFTSV